MGFDVLAFESGLFDLLKVWNLIEQGEPAATAMPKGIFSIWMGSAQLGPLVDYVQERARSENPLQLAGVDCQFSGSASEEGLVDSLSAFLEANGSQEVKEEGYGAFSGHLQSLAGGGWYGNKPAETEKDAFDTFIGGLRTELDGFPPGPEVDFWKQMLESIRQQAEFAWSYVIGEWNPGISSIRDRQMGDNLLWLLEERFPGKKVMVWAATLHSVRDLDVIRTAGQAMHEGYTSMGQTVWESIGEDAYVVGFTAAVGQFGNWASVPRQLDPPELGSLEDFFMRAGFHDAFLDFRQLPESGIWLQEKMIARPLGYVYQTARWPRHMDGIVFTREMGPSTPVGNGHLRLGDRGEVIALPPLSR